MISPAGEMLRRIKKLRYKIRRPVSAHYDDIILPLDFAEISESLRKTLYFGRYEVDEARIIHDKLAMDDIVLELGAGIGYLSALCAKRIGNERVYAFEANPNLEKVIRKTYALNAVQPALAMAALGHRPGKTSFFLEHNFWSSSTVKRSADATAIDVEMRDLNSEISRLSPTFLICDIEGGETELFSAIDFAGIRKLCVELHPHVVSNIALNGVLRKILEAGFECDFALSCNNTFFFERTPRPPGD